MFVSETDPYIGNILPENFSSMFFSVAVGLLMKSLDLQVISICLKKENTRTGKPGEVTMESFSLYDLY